MSGVLIRAMTATDWTAVESIYREGIATGNATFEAEPPTWTAFDSGKLALGRLIAEDAAGVVIGWVAASPVSSREVYRSVVEHSVYVANKARGRGAGAAIRRTAATRHATPRWRYRGRCPRRARSHRWPGSAIRQAPAARRRSAPRTAGRRRTSARGTPASAG